MQGEQRARALFCGLWVIVAVAKLVVAWRLPLFVDEAFYWQEGRHLAAAYSDLPGLTVGGFMTMAPLTDDEGVVRQTFSRLRELRDALRTTSGLELPELSMGMSHDFEIAIEEGATTVRIGSSIFGPRL